MKKNNVMLTAEGLVELKAELEELKNVKIPAVLDLVSKARDDGDLSENGAYIAGKQEQEFLLGRMEELEEILKNASIIKQTSGVKKAVDIGCNVTVTINGKNHSFMVVGDWEANPVEKKISSSSPLGQALIGRAIGEKVEVEAPAGKLTYTIVGIE